jgi:hypothetical protein
MVLWDTNIPKDLDGIPSYVHHVQVQRVRSRDEPVIFGRVLKTFSSMESLAMAGSDIPPLDELPGPASFGGFWKELTSLTLLHQSCTLATFTSLILFLANLKRLVIDQVRFTSEELISSLPDTSHRRPLGWLELQGTSEAVWTALV